MWLVQLNFWSKMTSSSWSPETQWHQPHKYCAWKSVLEGGHSAINNSPPDSQKPFHHPPGTRQEHDRILVTYMNECNSNNTTAVKINQHTPWMPTWIYTSPISHHKHGVYHLQNTLLLEQQFPSFWPLPPRARARDTKKSYTLLIPIKLLLNLKYIAIPLTSLGLIAGASYPTDCERTFAL